MTDEAAVEVEAEAPAGGTGRIRPLNVAPDPVKEGAGSVPSAEVKSEAPGRGCPLAVVGSGRSG